MISVISSAMQTPESITSKTSDLFGRARRQSERRAQLGLWTGVDSCGEGLVRLKSICGFDNGEDVEDEDEEHEP